MGAIDSSCALMSLLLCAISLLYAVLYVQSSYHVQYHTYVTIMSNNRPVFVFLVK